MSTKQDVTVRVTHRFNASPELVFDAWLDPDLINGWMFGPTQRDEEVRRVTVDRRVGGAFSFLVLRQGEEIDHTGEYLEIDRPRHLAFTWGAGPPGEKPDTSRVSIDIRATGDGCELTLTHEGVLEAYVKQTEHGWGMILDGLAKALAT